MEYRDGAVSENRIFFIGGVCGVRVVVVVGSGGMMLDDDDWCCAHYIIIQSNYDIVRTRIDPPLLLHF